jgi:hypothetical protein
MKLTERILEEYQRSVLDPISAKPHPLNRVWKEAVYFFEADEFVKIGYSRAPEKRFELFWQCNPIVEMFAYIPGTKEFEAYLHKKLRQSLYRNEWFRGTPSVSDAMAELALTGARFIARHKMKGWELKRCFPMAYAEGLGGKLEAYAKDRDI